MDYHKQTQFVGGILGKSGAEKPEPDLINTKEEGAPWVNFQINLLL
jgi:hypothetical protein